MKNVVIIENANWPFSEGIKMMDWIRREIQPEALTVISDGDFFSNGKAVDTSAARRAGRWKEAGADLVLQLPVSSILGGYGKKDFAVAALIQKLHSVERVVMPCRPLPGQTKEECEALLRKCAMLVFREHPDYRNQMKENLRLRKSFLQSQMEAIIYCIPEAEQLLRYSENRQSVSMLDAMLQLYYMVKIDFYAPGADIDDNHKMEDPIREEKAESTAAENKEEPTRSTDIEDLEISRKPLLQENTEQRLAAFNHHAAERFKNLLEVRPKEYLMNISGSTETFVGKMLELAEVIREKNSFQDILETVEPVFPNKDMARLFLLRALLNVRNSDMLISGLHTYVPYCLLLAEREEKPEEIKKIEEASWVPFVRVPDKGQENLSDDAIRILYAMDQRVGGLFQ